MNDLKDFETKIMELIPKDGKPIGNKKLLEELKKKLKDLSDDEYWKRRNELIASGKLTKGRGKGGSVYLPKDSQSSPEDKSNKSKKKKKEQDLYEPFIKVIKDYWVKDNDIDDYIISKTASPGSKKTGGQWTRPDVTLISVKTYQYLRDKIMDVITYEIKTEDNYGVASVFETASHSVFSNRSYLCINIDTGKPETEEFDRIVRQCEHFGVGLIVFEIPEDWETYETVVEPRRREPDPNEIDSFIKQQIPDKQKEELSKRIK